MSSQSGPRVSPVPPQGIPVRLSVHLPVFLLEVWHTKPVWINRLEQQGSAH